MKEFYFKVLTVHFEGISGKRHPANFSYLFENITFSLIRIPRTAEVAGFWPSGEGTLGLKIPTSLPMTATAFSDRADSWRLRGQFPRRVVRVSVHHRPRRGHARALLLPAGVELRQPGRDAPIAPSPDPASARRCRSHESKRYAGRAARSGVTRPLGWVERVARIERSAIRGRPSRKPQRSSFRDSTPGLRVARATLHPGYAFLTTPPALVPGRR